MIPMQRREFRSSKYIFETNQAIVIDGISQSCGDHKKGVISEFSLSHLDKTCTPAAAIQPIEMMLT